MSVLIRGMKMPKFCPMCPMSHWYGRTGEFSGCEVVPGKRFEMAHSKEYRESSTRPGWCPLTEVPDKHRLIDADALIDDCKKYLSTLNPDRDGKECTRIHWLIGVLSAAAEGRQ